MEDQQQEKPTITFEGTTHNIEDLSDQEKYFVSQIQDLSKQVGGVRAKLDQLEMSRKGFEDLLRASLKPAEHTEVIQ